MACIIEVPLYIYIQSIWPQMVVGHNRSSTWIHPLGELRDAPLAGCWGETMELEDGEPTINTPPHLSRHPNGICHNDWFWFAECRTPVRGYNTTRRGWFTQLCGSTSRTERVRPKVGKDIVCILIVWKDEMEMRWCLSTPESAEYILPIIPSTSVTPVFVYTRHRSLKMYSDAVIELG